MPALNRLVTHSGTFHADDVFAAATLRILWPDAPLERTRERERLEAVTQDDAIAVFDVGDHYDPDHQNFDHHQRGFGLTRPDGVPYAAFGLVWKTHGVACCRAALGDEALDSDEDLDAVHARVESKLVRAIDAADCGVLSTGAHLKDRPEVELQRTDISTLVSLYNPLGDHPHRIQDEAFERAMAVAIEVLRASIERALAFVEAGRVVAAHDDGSAILVLDPYVPWHDHIADHHRFVLSPAHDGSGWMVETVQDEYVPRCPFPEEWGGLRDEDLAQVSGVEDAIFCHRALFIGAAESKDGALTMAQKALAQHDT